MDPWLRNRATDLRERMDDPACDPRLLANTYRQFAVVNQLVSGWRGVFARFLAPALRDGSTLLDVGCGGGDLARRLAAWAWAAGAELRITAADPDERALDFARSRHNPPQVTFVRATAEELLRAGKQYDFVVSNHLLHHLGDDELGPFLESTARLARRVVLHNDLRRHPMAWLAFSLTRPFFRESFIVEDGLRSIRRAYTAEELEARVGPGWRVERLRPFRNLVVLER